MKAKSRSFLRGLLLAILTCIFALALAACGFGGNDDNNEKPAPKVENVTITAAEGAQLGKVDEEHVLSYTATNGSQITVTVKKDAAEATSGTDYTYNKDNKILVFKAAGAYTVTVTAKLNDKTGSASANITITAKDAPTVPEVELSVTAQGTAGYVGAAYQVSYNVTPAETQVTITVKKGNADAVKDTDYTLNGQELKFLTAGTYKVVATPEGGTAKESDEITIVVPTVSVSAQATAERGELIPLTIETTPAGLSVSVTLLNADGETAVDASKYEYNATAGNVKIKATGDYKIKATIVGTEVSDTTDTITVTRAPVPAFNLNADHTSVEENAVATISVDDIEYPHEGDTMASSTWKVEYSANGSDYADATANDCVWTEAENTIKPLKVGSYKITHSITCTGGHTGTESIEITATPATLTLTATTQGWTSIASATELAYTVEGYANNYEVSYAVTKTVVGQGDITKNSATEKQAASSVNVTGAAAIAAEYTVTYTHSADSNATYSVTFYVYGNAADGPAFGTNVTHNVLLPNVALKLYADEASGATVQYTLLDEGKAEITDLANVGKVIMLKDGATGTINVAVLATKEGKSSLAMQTFTVGTRGGDNAMNNYYTAVTGDSHTGINYNWLDNDNNVHKNDTLLTKEGFVFNRDNKDSLDGGDMVQIPLDENGANKKNLQLEFDFTILARHGEDNSNKSKNVSLAIFFRPAQNWGGNNQIAMYSDNESGMNTYTGTAKVAGTNPTFADGSNGLGYKIHVRITRIISNSKVLYLAEWKSAGSDAYTTWLTITANEENSGTTMGSPLTYIQFTHECGSYAIENLSYNGALELPTITATLDKNTVRVNETCSLEYSLANAISGNVDMKIYNGNVELASDKYTYNSETKALSFTEAGTYKIVLTAFGAATVEKEITVNPVPTVKVTLPAAVKVDTAATLTVEVKNTSETPNLEVQKLNNGTYEKIETGYSTSGNTITFTATGTYKVIASIEDGAIKGEATIIVSNASAPAFTVSASQASVTEGDAVTMTASEVTYDTAEHDEAGDGVVTYTVLYCVSGDSYAAIEDNASDYYTVSGNTVTLKMAGNYRIVGSVTSKLGITGTASADVTATPAVVSLAFNGTLTNGWYRMAANDTDTDIEYTVTGATNYTASYENGSASQKTAEAGKGLVQVHWAEGNTYLVKVIYTHKVITTAKYELTIKVHAVADLATSPILGADPFGDTPDELLPSFAYILYHDVYASNGTTELGDSAVSYEAIGGISNLEYTGGAPGLSIRKTATNEGFNAGADFPFVIVEHFENNSAHGTITIKMTITDGSNVAYASKTFAVTATNEVNATNVQAVNAYLQRVFPGTPLRVDNMGFDARQNGIIAKGGFMPGRHPDWSAGNSRVWDEFAQIQITDDVANNPVNNFQVDFDYSIVTKTDEGLTEIHLFPVTGGSTTAAVGTQYVLFNTSGAFGCCCWTTENKGTPDSTHNGATAWNPSANGGAGDSVAASNPTGTTVGTKIHVRLIHRVVGNTVRYELYFGDYGSSSTATLTPWFAMNVEKSTTAGHYGAPVSAIKLKQVAGCFGFESVTLTNLDA